MATEQQIKLHEVCSECFRPHMDKTNINSILTTGMCVKCLRKDHLASEHSEIIKVEESN